MISSTLEQGQRIYQIDSSNVNSAMALGPMATAIAVVVFATMLSLLLAEFSVFYFSSIYRKQRAMYA